MIDKKSVAIIILPPEYRPTDPYPPAAVDNPTLLFESYDDYHGWLSEKVCRLAIHDPIAGTTLVKRIAALPITGFGIKSQHHVLHGSEWFSPIDAGVICASWDRLFNDYRMTVSYAKFAEEGAAEPDIELLLGPIAPSSDGDARVYFASDGRRLSILTMPANPGGDGAFLYTITPEPLSGESRLTTTRLPQLASGTAGSDMTYVSAELNGDVFSAYTTRQDF
ncbi:hypothetical protein SAMN05216206_2747 [Pseudomonas guineae]|uniref:Uncharacterized protein n=1 Tax=Pseudomonas guineae TaxID=425504 RepID=A0A1I3K8Q5_9PSED|nr:hypothetical protein [Pseudomonas guineae]SFI68710.1 hypothetical protein SAMN05216206_2747 [Pseudomonas guineae]